MPPKGRSTKAAVDVTLPDDIMPDQNFTPTPVDEEAVGKDSAHTVNSSKDKAVAVEPASVSAAGAAGSSGLTVEEKSQLHQSVVVDEEEFLEDDSDEELDIDIAKEDAFRLRFTVILLIPMVLSQEIKAIISAVRLLMSKVWCSSLTANAGITTNIQEMTSGYVAKTRFCRLQISFLDERDAHHIKSHVFEYQKPHGPAIKCIWQHTEDSSYLKEKAAHPLAIEVLFRRVPANIVPEVLKDPLVRFKLKMRKQSAFKEGFAFHRVAHPLTASSLSTSALITPILKDPAIALISTGSNREEWICRQLYCGKAKGKSFMAAADHIVSATHLLNLEKLGTATKVSLDKAVLASLKKDYGF
ncbi:unnamed protein product [Closterium sp. NIES-64]|nr:unnamed protein product [Closterium sp. NIES-64]